MVSAPDLLSGIGMMLTPFLYEQAPFPALLHKRVMLFDTAAALQILPAV